jgi:hypothetical protein
MTYERIGPPMRPHEIMALKAALAVLRHYAHPGVVDVLAQVVRDEEAKRRRIKALAGLT